MIKTDNKHILTYVSSLLYMAVYTVTEDNSTTLATYPNKRAFSKSELSICVGYVILNHLVVAQMKF